MPKSYTWHLEPLILTNQQRKSPSIKGKSLLSHSSSLIASNLRPRVDEVYASCPKRLEIVRRDVTLARRNTTEQPQNTNEMDRVRSPAINVSSPAQAVSLLSPQIPDFGGTDEENVQVWTQRVDRVS